MARFKRWIKLRLAPFPRLFALAHWLARRASRLCRALGIRSTLYWDQAVAEVESSQPRGWLDWEWVEVEHVRPLVSGDREVNYLQHLSRRHLPEAPVERALSLGCGGGNLERAMSALRLAHQSDGLDSSPASIELARRLAAEQGLAERLHYELADVDRLILPAATYDLVICKMSLHHFEALEEVYRQIRQSLKPGGLFVFNEFVGPSRFQWTDAQLHHANQMLTSLPRAIRRRIAIPAIVRPTVAEMIEIDPTESIRSAEILPLLESEFEILELRPYGGTLLHLVLHEAMAAMDLENPQHVALLQAMSRRERELIATGELQSDFAYGVARPRPAAQFE